ncbi:TetR/AcrR family transcriptional regulator (plasmid) [Streptomyces sp. NBC_01387]|uniref:ScbR family autoregulator-binding transcription factor n=1 Tax=unclassified Streptomyces TaxID=2593676 RepID=UPI00202527B6|nr:MULTISPECIES: ScbR family autoregulator-binding transcription factor [unclassified Streptomyces]MCX4554457.1 ScbR family autoregulator-binding transcription factor [Streptomyces sp. NBC_01500]WSC25159.1 TetR/AcrR family transcriptional regulator [Streptomyces sp. NBC_01766]WSV58959.1 TetR/AcrR family transcriptional regulator [Streptomyces sp. NBC_01014]
MAQQERAIRTRRVILEAAASVFDECGYDAATVGEILARAKVTKGALYFHFPSKQALAQGVLEEQMHISAVPPRPCKLQELVDTALALAHRMRRDPLVSAGARLSLGQEALTLFDGGAIPLWIHATQQIIEEAKKQGELLPHVDPVETTWIISAAWTGVQVYSHALSNRADLETRVVSLLQHLLPSVAVPAVLATLEISTDRGARVIAELGELDADRMEEPLEEAAEMTAAGR